MADLLDLPQHLLVRSLSYLDVESLLTVGLTCRRLYALTTLDEVWREQLLKKYDDPRNAAAYPSRFPRRIEWRKRMIDREVIIRFLDRHRIEGREQSIFNRKKSFFRAWASKVCPTVLDLFLDIPPPGQISANVPIIMAFLSDNTLAYMCHTFDTAEANHLEALFDSFMSFQGNRLPGSGQNRHLGQKLPAFNSYCDAEPKRPWVFHAAGRWPVNGIYQVDDNGEIDLTSAFQALRGEALSELTRHPACSAQDIWDWAGMEGLWTVSTTRTSVLPPRRRRLSIPSRPTLSLCVATRDTVETAYAAWGKGDIWTDFGPLPSTTYGLAPIYFHGTCVATVLGALNPSGKPWPGGSSRPLPFPFDGFPITDRDVDGVTAFINGVAYLDSDPDSVTGLDPPQVRCTLAITTGDVADTKRIVMRGVEPWGPRSRVGVFGPYHRGGQWSDNYARGFMRLRRAEHDP